MVNSQTGHQIPGAAAAGAVFGHDGISVGGAGNAGMRAARTADRVRPRDSFHCDHTSILKTIARRFLSSNPPYMGGRFAAAHDLSEVLGNHLRQPQFLPFIRYRLEYVRSQMLLAVKQANRAPGTELLQLPRDDEIAQDFSFEDAGNGFVYIRSHVSNLYMTVQVPDVITGGMTTSAARRWRPRTPRRPLDRTRLRRPTRPRPGP